MANTSQPNEEDPTRPEFKTIKPLSVYEFREIDPRDPVVIPELYKNRRCTDVHCFFIFAVVVLGWLIFAIYVGGTMGANLGNIYKVVDKCGNVCGVDNKDIKIEGNCVAKNYTKETILFISGATRQCRSTCNTMVTLKRCYGSKKRTEEMDVLDEVKSEDEVYIDDTLLLGVYAFLDGIVNKYYIILTMVVIALVGSLMLIFFLRCNVCITFTVLLVLQVLFFIACVATFWYIGIALKQYLYIFFALLYTVMLVVFLGFLCMMRKRYKLVIALWEEVIACTCHSITLIAVPIMSSLFLLIYHIAFILLILSAFIEIKGVDDNLGIRFGLIMYTFILFVWMNAFANGTQCMIVAGASGLYYFSRDKSNLPNTFVTSIKTVLRFHLGSIAKGSLIITIINILRMLAEMAQQMAYNEGNLVFFIVACCCACILQCIEEIVEYFTKKAYIQIALHGKPFCTSALRGCRLFFNFLLDMLYVDVLGYMAIQLAMFLVTTVAIVIAIMMGYKHLGNEPVFSALLMGAIAAGSFTFFYAALLNVAAETMFICYCEDLLMNDGSRSSPYFMSKKLQTTIATGMSIAKAEHEEKVAEIRERQESRTAN